MKVFAIPPGETMLELLEDRDISKSEFAAMLDMTDDQVDQLISGEMKLTPQIADQLEAAFGVPARFWVNLECIYRGHLESGHEVIIGDLSMKNAMLNDLENVASLLADASVPSEKADVILGIIKGICCSAALSEAQSKLLEEYVADRLDIPPSDLRMKIMRSDVFEEKFKEFYPEEWMEDDKD